MIRVDLENGLQVALGEDQQPISAFAADTQDPPFGHGIGFRGLGRGAQYL